MMDSEQVPWGKSEKDLERGVKRPWNFKNDKQLGIYQCTFCIMDQRLNLCQQASYFLNKCGINVK